MKKIFSLFVGLFCLCLIPLPVYAGSGFVKDEGGHMDEYYDAIYVLHQGDIYPIIYGHYGAEDHSNVQYDANLNPIYEYSYDDTIVTKSEYESKMQTLFPKEQAVKCYSYEGYTNDYVKAYEWADVLDGTFYNNIVSNQASNDSSMDINDFAGNYTKNFDVLTIKETGKIQVSIYRLCTIDSDTYIVQNNILYFTGLDPAGNTIQFCVQKKGDKSCTLSVVNSTWEYLNIGDTFYFNCE